MRLAASAFFCKHSFGKAINSLEALANFRMADKQEPLAAPRRRAFLVSACDRAGAALADDFRTFLAALA
jgi:hypothetical protein